jgi:hypothetical protein
MINDVLNIYYDPKQGLTSANDIYKKLNKKYKLIDIKNVLENVKNKQMKSNNDEKLYIPISTPSHSFSIDLTFYTQYQKVNSGYHILMTIINNNTKKAYVYPLKNKQTKSIIDAFKLFLNNVDFIEQLQADYGSEFKSKEFKKICDDNNIKLFLHNTTENKHPLGIIERFNRTIRSKIDNYMTAYNTKKYIDVLDKLVQNYNNTIHSTTKMKPNDVNKTKENVISNNQLKNYIDVKQEINNNFEIGDFIRILKKRKLFGKGPSEYYSKTLYEIIERNNNKFIIRSNNNKIQEVLPFQMKKIDDDMYENPYLKNSNIDNQKKIIKSDKKLKMHQRKLKKEGIDIDLQKQKKLINALKKLN